MLHEELPPIEDYATLVLSEAGRLLAEGGERPLEGDFGILIAEHHEMRDCVQSAALWLVGGLRSARMGKRESFERGPWDPQERRVLEYLVRESGIGAGMDPVGFLVASHGYMAYQNRDMRNHIASLRAQIESAGLVPVPSPGEVPKAEGGDANDAGHGD